ncbi:MAG: ABC transporter permease [Microbacterium sp.]
MNTSTGSATISTPQATLLVAEREIVTKVRSKTFLISTAILVLIALAGVIWMGVQASKDEALPVAATSDIASQLDPSAFTVTEVAGRAQAEKLVASGDVDAAAISDPDSPTGVTVIADDENPDALISALSVSPTVDLLHPDVAAQKTMRYILGLAFALVFMLSALSFGTPITQSVVEEKQTRVVEILISAIPSRVLLAGKVLGNTILALGQILLLVAVVIVGLTVTGQIDLLRGLGSAMLWFVVFFLFGFILLASMFATAGALVSRQEDTGATLQPVMWLVMLPYFLVIFLGENPLAMTVLSYVPFSAPIAMPVRLYFGDAAWWEPLVSLVVMLALCGAVVMLGAKIYENSLLRMGARVKLLDALKG